MERSQEINDCGVCAIANALDLSWASAALRIFGIKYRNKLRFGSTTRQLVKALGIAKPKLIRVKSWAEVPDGSVVKVIPLECEGTGNWHWVAYRGGKVYCSCGRWPVDARVYRWRLVSYLGREGLKA